jgi:O-methyltransferase
VRRRLKEVQANIFSTGYPKNQIHLIKGMVEETILKITPRQISLLRLDTDWYESTKHELTFLFPLLQPGES